MTQLFYIIKSDMRKKSFLFAGLFLWSFLICGCVHHAVIHSDVPAENIIHAIPGIMNDHEIMSAMVKIELVTSDGYFPARVALIIKKPSYLRLEVLSLVGPPMFFLAASPEKISVFLPAKQEFYYGKPTAGNLQKFLHLRFEIEDIVNILAGTFPPFKNKEIAYQVFQEQNAWRVEMKADSGISQTLWVEENNRLLKLTRRDENGEELYTVQYIYDAPQRTVPVKIIINMADGLTSLVIKYSDIHIERTEDVTAFEMDIPSHVKAIALD